MPASAPQPNPIKRLLINPGRTEIGAVAASMIETWSSPPTTCDMSISFRLFVRRSYSVLRRSTFPFTRLNCASRWLRSSALASHSLMLVCRFSICLPMDLRRVSSFSTVSARKRVINCSCFEISSLSFRILGCFGRRSLPRVSRSAFKSWTACFAFK